MPEVQPTAPVNALAASLSFLGPWGALASLALTFGVPFVTKLIANSKNSVDPTPEEWASLEKLISIPGEVLIPQRVVTP